MNKRQAAEQLRRALQLFVQTLSEARALEVATVFPAWEANRSYAVGEIVSCGVNTAGDPQLYKVVQAHTSAAEWTPDTAASLYGPLGLDESGYPVWSRPSGAHDAYDAGDVVSYSGSLYRSLIDGNTWSPEAYPDGWEAYTAG